MARRTRRSRPVARRRSCALLVGGGRQRWRQLRNVEQPAADAEALDQVMATVRRTGMASRSPEKLAELLASMGDGGNVYVPAGAVRAYLQALDPREVVWLVRMLGIEDQLERAMLTGGDVVIPLHPVRRSCRGGGLARRSTAACGGPVDQRCPEVQGRGCGTRSSARRPTATSAGSSPRSSMHTSPRRAPASPVTP
jgi:hypothetical protein